MVRWLWVAAWVAAAMAVPLPHEVDSEQTRKLLGSSVVTSVSVIMDHGNGTKTYLTDNQPPEKRPQVVGTPGTLLAPDRYEFYSFGEDGELVKKLMTLDQIQSLIASGDDLEPLPVYYPQPLVDSSHTEGVHKVLESVQNVLKGELQAAKDHPKVPMPLPDDSWSILLPGLLNSELDFKDAHIPVKNDAPSVQTVSNDLQSAKLESTTLSQIKTTIASATSPKPHRPTSQSTIQYSTTRSTTPSPETSTVRKTTTDIKYTTYQNTPAPFIKTTGHYETKAPNQKPISTTKRPNISTKKPYINDSALPKVPSTNQTKIESTTKTTTTSSKKPVVSEERNPGTKSPDVNKPLPEKKKPSGIPTITHYLPLSSSSMPPNTTTHKVTTSPEETTTIKHKVSSPTKAPARVTTRRPTTVNASSPLVQHKNTYTTTKKPVTTQNKPTSTNHQKTTTQPQKTTPQKTTQKLPRPTTATPILTTKLQNKITTVAQTTAPTTIKNKVEFTTVTMKTETEEPSTIYEIINVTTKEPPLPNPQKLVQVNKPNSPKPSSNLIGQSSNVVNTKIKPADEVKQSTALPTTTISEKPTLPSVTTTTQPPERITTFFYTSKLTPSGEIITSTVPSVTITTSKINPNKTSNGTATTTTNSNKVTSRVPTVSSTTVKWSTTSTFQTTDKPMQKITLTNQHSIQNSQASKGQTTAPTSFKPTTYHPQNFNSGSRKPVTQVQSSTANSFSTKPTILAGTQKTTTGTPTTVNYSVNASTSSVTVPTQSTAYSTVTPTTQGNTKPVTDSTPEGTTISMTTLGTSVSSDSTVSDSSTFLTEELPLQEIPLKLYESLKNGPQDIMTTIVSENMQTTTGKTENTYATTNSNEIAGSTVIGIDKLTTIMTSTTAIPTTASPPLMERVNETVRPEIQHDPSTTENNDFNKEPLQESASMPVVQQKNITFVNNTIAQETTTIPATDVTNTSEQSNSESTTAIDSTTIYKDQVLQEGISAVTSILLDEAQRHQAIKEAMLASSMNNDQIKDFEKSTTTEDELTTTIQDSTEGLKQESDKDQMKSEVRLNEDAELPDKLTSEIPETTTQDKPKTTIRDIIKASMNENIKNQEKKNEQKPLLALPTKESKLNPESDLHHHINQKKPEMIHMTEGSIMLRTTAGPEIPSSTERLKISDFEKSAPKPISPFAKKPNPLYQSLESLQPPAAIELHPAPYESMGLEASIAFLGEDVRRFADLCNELAFRMWTSITGKGQIASRSLVMSPFAVTSLLAMVFLGARGPTSGQMNDVLRLDDMVTFNPHQVLQNVTESVINSKNHGVATAAFVRELYSDKTKGKILDFYKERVQQYYQGHVEEVNFSIVGDIIRRRTNLLVKRQTLGKVPEYLRGSSLNMRPPLAAFSANIFQTDCDQGSTDGRDGEMYFVVRPSTRQRRLVPVPAVVWRTGFLAGYEPSLDATSVCLGADSVVSTILILPGQQGQVAPGDGLARLEQRLIETSYRRGGWSRLLRSLMPRPGLELQLPRFSHRSVLNITGALQRMGLRDLFNTRADLRGLNGLSNDLHLSDMLQVNTFSTCGEETIGARHHVETYPASPQRMGRDDPEYYPPKDFENIFGDIPLSVRPRQARLPDNPRLRFDRPFLYMVRHNPSGMILHMGRFNPRLLP